MSAEAFFLHLVKTIIPFLPVLFGAVEFLKKKQGWDGALVEWVTIGIFVVYGALSIVAFFFPGWAAYLLGGAVFLLACAVAPSGFYKFVAEFKNS